MSGAVLVACVGNIFLGDDAFGVEVARSLAKRRLPRNVLVRDFGIRGFDLAYALLEPWDAVILVDALPRGDAPGTLYVVEPDLARMGGPATPGMEINPHGMDPVRVLNLALSMGPIAAEVFVVGCEPNDFGDELEGRMGLSGPVQAVVEEASNMVEELVARIRMQSAGTLIETQTVEAP
jgi:hydrogenase maturation protease